MKDLSDKHKKKKEKGKTNYQAIDKKVKKKCNEADAEYLERKFDEVEDSIPVNPAGAHRRTQDISGKERYSCKTCLIKDKNGTLTIKSNDVEDHRLKHTKEICPCRSDSKPFRFEEPLSGPPILKEEFW